MKAAPQTLPQPLERPQSSERHGPFPSRGLITASSIGWPSCAPFVLSYLGVLLLFNTFGVLHLSPRLSGDYGLSYYRLDFSFYLFWHEAGLFGLSLLTVLMSTNTLVSVYLWACYRNEGRRELGKRWFFLTAGVTLMTLQLLYWKLGVFDPQPITLLPLPL